MRAVNHCTLSGICRVLQLFFNSEVFGTTRQNVKKSQVSTMKHLGEVTVTKRRTTFLDRREFFEHCHKNTSLLKLSIFRITSPFLRKHFNSLLLVSFLSTPAY